MSPITHREIEGEHYFEAEDDRGEFQGLAVITQQKNTVTLESIFTPYPRRQGWGSALIQAVFTWARTKKCTELAGELLLPYPDNQDETVVRAFYTKHGIDVDSDNRLHKKF